jgi:5-methylcytosine-specific restriction protein A
LVVLTDGYKDIVPTLNRIKKTLIKPKDNDNWSKDKFYNKQTWRKLRNHHIRTNPICSSCHYNNAIVSAYCVDHIKPRRLWPELSLSQSNLNSLCNDCHLKKSRLERDCKDKAHWYNVMSQHERYL